MRKVIVYIAMSLDGYIADQNGGVGWLAGDGSDTENLGSYPQFIETIDIVMLGYKTYHQIITELSPDKWAYEDKQSYVLTHKEVQNTDKIFFTSESMEKLIQNLKTEDGKNIWICGGASIINQLINLNLVDEFTLTIMPTILGGGIRLFDSLKMETHLKLKSTQTYNGIVESTYECRK